MSNRPETGPMQFGADWPGIFLRGDDAHALAFLLDQVERLLESGEGKESLKELARFQLGQYSEMLKSCDTRRGEPPDQQLPEWDALLNYTASDAESSSSMLRQLYPQNTEDGTIMLDPELLKGFFDNDDYDDA